MTGVSSRSEMSIAELDNELTYFINQIELKFRSSELRRDETVLLLGEIASCSYELWLKLYNLTQDVEINNIINAVSWVYGASEGALDDYASGEKIKFYKELISDVWPLFSLYLDHRDELKELNSR